jgi:hypothetical protein
MANEKEDRYVDPVIERYKKDIDVTMIIENLKLTPDQRVRKMEAALRDLAELRRAMIEAKAQQADR